MSKIQQKIPKFISEKQERQFWHTHDSTEYLDWSKAKVVRFPNLKPSTQTISLRLPESRLDSIKRIANKKMYPINH